MHCKVVWGSNGKVMEQCSAREHSNLSLFLIHIPEPEMLRYPESTEIEGHVWVKLNGCHPMVGHRLK